MMKHNVDQLIRQKDVLNTLAHCKPLIRKAILKNADKELVEVICHCVFNMLHGNITISAAEQQKLSAYKNRLRKLVEKSSFRQKKKLLEQSGGFLEYLIPAAITGISSIISSFINSSKNNSSQ